MCYVCFTTCTTLGCKKLLNAEPVMYFLQYFVSICILLSTITENGINPSRSFGDVKKVIDFKKRITFAKKNKYKSQVHQALPLSEKVKISDPFVVFIRASGTLV